ncbi:tetratricopeptide repeat protein [soil metagenome]
MSRFRFPVRAAQVRAFLTFRRPDLAVPPNTNEAFLREVDEELRRDQVADLWRNYGRWAIAAIVAALAAFAGVLWWNHHSEVVAGKQGESYQATFEDLSAGKLDSVAKPLGELAASKIDGYRAMAKFTQADVLLSKKDGKGAAAKFAEIAKDDSLAQPFRDLALVRQTATEFDSLKPEVVVSRLRPLAAKGNPWFGSAGELVAVAYIDMGRRDLAGQLFSQIAADEGVPATLRQRAVQMAGVLGVDAVDQDGDKKSQ